MTDNSNNILEPELISKAKKKTTTTCLQPSWLQIIHYAQFKFQDDGEHGEANPLKFSNTDSVIYNYSIYFV